MHAYGGYLRGERETERMGDLDTLRAGDPFPLRAGLTDLEGDLEADLQVGTSSVPCVHRCMLFLILVSIKTDLNI